MRNVSQNTDISFCPFYIIVDGPKSTPNTHTHTLLFGEASHWAWAFHLHLFILITFIRPSGCYCLHFVLIRLLPRILANLCWSSDLLLSVASSKRPKSWNYKPFFLASPSFLRLFVCFGGFCSSIATISRHALRAFVCVFRVCRRSFCSLFAWKFV